MLCEGQKAVRLIITGRVQGVCFRYWTMQNANQLSLDGWVRNRSDGSVEALLVGEKLHVEDMMHRCEEGPPTAKVDKIDVSEAIGITARGFVLKPTVNLHERKGLTR